MRVALLLTGQALSLVGSSIVQYAVFWYLVMQHRLGRHDDGCDALRMRAAGRSLAVRRRMGGPLEQKGAHHPARRAHRRRRPSRWCCLDRARCRRDSRCSSPRLRSVRPVRACRCRPCSRSFLDITPEEKLLRVNSINGTIQSVNMIAAPAIAAVLINIMPLWAILYVDVTTAVVGIAFVALIRVQRAAAHRGRRSSAIGPCSPRCARGCGTRGVTRASAACSSRMRSCASSTSRR